MKVVVGQGIQEDKPPFVIPENRNFNNFLAGYGEYVKDQEASKKIHLWTSLSMIAGALERKVWLHRGYFNLFPNLFVCIVGVPGLVKKSTATGIGVNFLRDLEHVNVMSEQITDAALIDAFRNSHREFEARIRPMGPAKLKQSALYYYGSEMSVTFKNAYGPITELMTTFYDCQPSDANKPWVRETKMHGQVKVFGPCINMLACTTPTWLKDTIPVKEMEGGFASRILFVIEDGKPEKSVAIPRIDKSLDTHRQRLFEDLTVIHNLSGEMKMTEAAEALFTEFYAKNHSEIASKIIDARLSGYYGRKPTMVEKVSMCLSAAERNDLIITPEHVEMAIGLVTKLEQPMLDAFAYVGRSPMLVAFQKLVKHLRILEPKKCYTEAELSRLLFRDVTKQEFDNLMQQAMQMNLVNLERLPNAVLGYSANQDALATLGD